jgi:hypothetical protein
MVFGEQLINHTQANFSILTALKQSSVSKVCVVTDVPNLYAALAKDERVDVFSVESETIQSWMGKHKLVYRTKMKAFQLVAEKYPNTSIVYLDSDTFVFGDLKEMNEDLDNNISFMHLPEGKLSEMSAKTMKVMWKESKGKEVAGIVVNQDHKMWNAGVIGIPGKRLVETVDLALNVCDELCELNSRIRLVEQFSYSLVLTESGELRNCDQWLGHYWGNKPGWDEFILAFFAKSQIMGYQLSDQLEQINEEVLRSIPVHVKRSSTKSKLNKRLDKTFKDKPTYLKV